MHAEFESQSLKCNNCMINLCLDGKVILNELELPVAVAGFYERRSDKFLNPLNAELNSIFHLLALLGARHILHVSRIRVNALLPFS